MYKNTIPALFALIFVSCAGDLTKEQATEKLASQSEFQSPFYASMHLAAQVLTGDNHKDPKAFITHKYGKLIDEGLVEAKLGGNNSWRTILRIELTEKGQQLENKSRSVDDLVYVDVCRMVVDSVLSIEPLGAGDTILCRYQFSERDLTPFGQTLGFIEGRTHIHERKFVRSTFSWTLIPL